MTECPVCRDSGHVCEDHPTSAWGGMCCDPYVLPAVLDAGYRPCEHGACHCGAAGMPCPQCCDPIPQDGTHSIVEAFTPRHLTTDTRWAAADPRPAEQQWDQTSRA